MADSESNLIHSKLLAPSPAGLLHRPRVYQAIEEGLERKLTLVSAPAGYGKTSALVDFARRSPVPVCWYTADERDRDLGTFVEYLVSAIGKRFPNFGGRTREALASLPDKAFQDPTVVVEELADEILDLDTPFVLVVDGYEALEGALGIREFFPRLIEILPLNCHLMLGSRVLPDAPIARLIAERQLAGLAENDLRFESREIQELLRLSGLDISNNQAEALTTSAEGWITGVLLLADLLRDGTRPVLLDAERATAQTYGYLVGEVLGRLPGSLRDFLYVSAVLREMSLWLCSEMLQIERAHALLMEVEQRNLFITRFGQGAAATYRYHDLFRGFLHEQLRRSDPARYAELHLRAAGWFEQGDDVDEAVYHYLAAGAWTEATVLMEQVVGEWFTRGRVETLLYWAETLPEKGRVKVPRLLLYQSMVLTDRYDYEGAKRALAHAENGLLVRKETASLAWVHNQRATLALFEGRYQDTISEAQAALEVLGPDEVAWRAQAQRLIGRAYVGMGRLTEGLTCLENALAPYQQSSSLYDVVNLLQDLSYALTVQGRLNEALVRLSEALPICRKIGAPILLAGVLNSLGWNHYLRGEHRKALALYKEGATIARRGNDPWHQAYISVGIADLYRDIGAYEQAEPLYDIGWQIARDSRPTLAVYILAARVSMYRWRKEHTQMLALLEQARRLAEEKGLDFEARGPLAAAEGIALAESGKVEVGLRLLSNATDFLEQQQAKRELTWARFLLAQACLLAGDKSEAVAELRQAIELADENDMYQFIIAESQHAKALIDLGIAKDVAGCRTIIEGVQRLRAFGKELVQDSTESQEDTAGRLKIYAFGEGRVVRNKQTVTLSEWQATKARELFFYVLLHGPLERNTVTRTFWPDLPAERVARSLYSMVYRVRRAVGANAIVFREGKYHIGDLDYWFDVEEFEALIEQARRLPPHDWQAEHLWQRAVDLYQGDFLPEAGRTWCVPKREALRKMYIEALIGVGRCREAQQEFEKAVAWYQRALEMDMLREDIHRRIMRCYAETGFRSEALAQYCHCQRALRRELNVEPSTETKDLLTQIIGDK